MLLALVLLFVILSTLFLILIYGFSRLDSDVTLWLAEKFGHSKSSLRNKVVWITGASSGIGQRLAYVLAKEGVQLVLSGTNEANLKATKEKCLELNPALRNEDVFIAQFDIRDCGKHESILKDVLKHFKQVDILVNNAGKSQRAAFDEIDIKVDKDLFDINVFGLINLTRVVVRHWYETGLKGHILVNSSGAGKMPVTNSASYTASKHALHGYFECLRVEGYSRGIAVTMVCPGPVFSNVLKNALTGKPNETVGQEHAADAKRMPTERCADLMAIAMANQLWECWVCEQPLLTGYYLFQYAPSIAKWLTCKFMPPEKFTTFREGH